MPLYLARWLLFFFFLLFVLFLGGFKSFAFGLRSVSKHGCCFLPRGKQCCLLLGCLRSFQPTHWRMSTITKSVGERLSLCVCVCECLWSCGCLLCVCVCVCVCGRVVAFCVCVCPCLCGYLCECLYAARAYRRVCRSCFNKLITSLELALDHTCTMCTVPV